MEHNELIDTMLHTITVEREATRERLRYGGKVKDSFTLSGLTGDQLGAVKQFIASFRLNA